MNRDRTRVARHAARLERSFPRNGKTPLLGMAPALGPLAEETGVRSEPRRCRSFRLTGALAAALGAGTCLAPPALGADSSSAMCPDDSPLGGWVRLQRREQVRQTGHDGCDLAVNSFMSFDLVPIGPGIEQIKAQQAAEVARLPNLSPQAREQMLNARLAWLAAGGRAATKLRYKMWSDGCRDIGGAEFTCNGPGGRAAGELTLGEETPTGFRPFEQPQDGPVYSLAFNPMLPSLDIKTGGRAESLPQLNAKCVSSNSVGGHLLQSGGLAALSFTISPQPKCDPSNAMYFCNPPTVCFNATDATQRRECAVNPGKFAALPFEGNMENRSPAGIVSSKISWKVCCGCGQIGGTHH